MEVVDCRQELLQEVCNEQSVRLEVSVLREDVVNSATCRDRKGHVVSG